MEAHGGGCCRGLGFRGFGSDEGEGKGVFSWFGYVGPLSPCSQLIGLCHLSLAWCVTGPIGRVEP